MKANRILSFSGVTVIIASMIFFVSSCKWDDCGLNFCSDCEIVMDDCTCLKDSINYKCPPGAVHDSFYNYSSWYYPACSCICDPGWAGVNCDQRDTTYYIRFRYGSDTTALSGLISTHDYIQWLANGLNYEGYFPAGSGIGTFRIKSIPVTVTGSITLVPGPFQICEDDSACTYLEMAFESGGFAYSIAGAFTEDTFNLIPSWFGGTFKANLQVSGTGQNYYIREGTFRLPIDL